MSEVQLMTIGEYKRTVFEADCEFVDGEVLERNWCDYNHSTLQTAMMMALCRHDDEWNIDTLPALRVQISPTRIRVPDVCVLRADDPHDQIVQKAPLICIEVLSQEDTFSRLQVKVDDYLAMGVEHIWIVDSVNRRAYTADRAGFIEVKSGEFVVPGTPIRVDLTKLFAELE
jgi:Uma2 family endonuclease